MHYISTLLLFLCCTLLAAQGAQWQAGYVLTPDGARQDGQVRIPGGLKEVSAVSFRAAAGTSEVTYTPEEITGFGTEARNFVAYRIQYNTSPRVVRKMELGKEYPDNITTAFLEQFYAGAFDFYRYIDSRGMDHYYIGSAGANPEYLRTARQLIRGAGRYELIGFDTYQQQLERRFGSCGQVSDIASEARYELASLLNVVDRLLACSGSSQDLIHRPDRGEFSVGLLAGISHLTLSGENMAYQIHTPGKAQAGWVPTIGAIINYRTPYRRMISRLRLQYESFHVQGFQRATVGRPDPEGYPTKLMQRTLYGNLGVTLQVSGGHFPLLLDMGVIYGHILKNERSTYQLFFTQPAEYSVKSYTDGADYGLSLGLGTKVGPVGLQAEVSFVDRSTELLYSAWRYGITANYMLALSGK